jgi:hypothetical protein
MLRLEADGDMRLLKKKFFIQNLDLPRGERGWKGQLIGHPLPPL